jgi:hypothetical protein
MQGQTVTQDSDLTRIKMSAALTGSHQPLGTRIDLAQFVGSDVASFNGARFSSVDIASGDITGRALDIVIEPGVGSAAQQRVLSSIVECGALRGVTVTVVPFG